MDRRAAPEMRARLRGTPRGPVRPPRPPGLSWWPFGLVFPQIVGCQLREFFPQLAQLLVVETIPSIQLLLELQQAGCGLGPCRVRSGGCMIDGWLAHVFFAPYA